MMNKIFYLINDNKERLEAKIISQFKINNTDYVTYTLNELNDEGMVKIYVTSVIDNMGIITSKEITSDDEWTIIKNTLKVLAKSIEEPVPESIITSMDIEGMEIEIARPKKLLVSKQFTEVLERKDTVKKVNKVELPSFELPKVEEQAIEPEIEVPAIEPEPEIEKTIKIPTFEELQARNKNIQAVRETAMENVVPEVQEPVRTPVVEPVIEKTVELEPKKESKVNSEDYKEKFKKDVEPVLLDIYAEKQKRIEELEEELSKTKFDLFEKQKEALSLSHEKEEYIQKNQQLEEQLSGVQQKMNGILDVLQGNDK